MFPRLFIRLLVGGMLISAAGARSPDPGRIEYYESSAHGTHLIRCHPKTGTLCTEVPSGVEKWIVPCWFRGVKVGGDGRYLAAIGENAKDYQPADGPDVVLITFFKDGRLLREVKAKEVFPDPRRLPRDEEVLWGWLKGFRHTACST